MKVAIHKKNCHTIQALLPDSLALPLLQNGNMGILAFTVVLVSLFSFACHAPNVSLHDTREPRLATVGQDLLLMADERQALHYRYLAAEHVGAASRFSEDGDEATSTQMLYGAIEYQGIAEEIEQRAANRQSTGADLDSLMK
ncbi:MAG TPA: hypothetical protein VJV04_13745 [Nitrospiraceae bacterium]|nr:hypothetical protein [Nitrospiraceae bacterium]